MSQRNSSWGEWLGLNLNEMTLDIRAVFWRSSPFMFTFQADWLRMRTSTEKFRFCVKNYTKYKFSISFRDFFVFHSFAGSGIIEI